MHLSTATGRFEAERGIPNYTAAIELESLRVTARALARRKVCDVETRPDVLGASSVDIVLAAEDDMTKIKLKDRIVPTKSC
jgi:hypothetical protein